MNTVAPMIRDASTAKLFRAGSTILFQGEIPRDVLIIQDGIIRSYTIGASGDERIIALYGKGDLLPMAWALGSTNASFTYYEAINDVRALALPKPRFDDYLNTDIAFSKMISETAGKEFAGSILRIMSLTQSKTIDKLAYTFYYLAHRFGIERGENQVEINMKLSQIMLASMIGQTREGTARNLKDLVAKGAVTYKGSTYNVNVGRILALLGEESFRELL